MKRMMILSLSMGLCLASVIARAEEPAAAQAPAAVEVGNKICPVSGDKIGENMEPVKVEHNGKIYNLCCGMCKGDFTKNPDKYIKIVEDEMKEKKD